MSKHRQPQSFPRDGEQYCTADGCWKVIQAARCPEHTLTPRPSKPGRRWTAVDAGGTVPVFAFDGTFIPRACVLKLLNRHHITLPTRRGGR